MAMAEDVFANTLMVAASATALGAFTLTEVVLTEVDDLPNRDSPQDPQIRDRICRLTNKVIVSVQAE
jgi:hypothetical protein